MLDRDGTLNRIVVDPEHGTIDSPLHPDQVRVDTEVPEALARLNRAGFGLAIVTNQPASAKGKTTRANLQAVHEAVLRQVQSKGATILSSHICFHRSEDQCPCRKPKTTLLEEAFKNNPGFDTEQSWMVGDGVSDVQAGAALKLRTIFLGPRKCDACKVFEDLGSSPTHWAKDLGEAAQIVLSAAEKG